MQNQPVPLVSLWGWAESMPQWFPPERNLGEMPQVHALAGARKVRHEYFNDPASNFHGLRFFDSYTRCISLSPSIETDLFSQKLN
jgi:hypothetical protein